MDQKMMIALSMLSPRVAGPMLQQYAMAQKSKGSAPAAPTVAANANPIGAIQSQYTSQQGGDSGLAPMAMYQAAKRGPAVAQGRGVGGK